MSEVYVPTHTKLLIPTVRALIALGGSGTPAEILSKIIESENLDDAVLDVVMGDQQSSKLVYRASWARTLLKGYGAVENSQRGVWTLTDLGEKLTDEDESKIQRHWDNLRKEITRNRKYPAGAPIKVEKAPLVHETVVDESTDEYPVDDQNWKQELLNVLYTIPPAAFERLCQRLLRESGFIEVEVMGRSGDGGLDGVGILRMNLVSFRVHFQCKRYQGGISNAAIRDFRGATVGRSDRGLFITTGHFTRAAKEEASRDGAALIDLIDGETLCDLLYDLKLGVSVQTVERVVVDRRWYEGI